VARSAQDHGCRAPGAERRSRWSVRRLALFGSALRADFTAQSDVDVLVESQPGQTPSLGLFELESELGELLGRRVDVHAPGFLSPYFRGTVMREALDKYVARQ